MIGMMHGDGFLTMAQACGEAHVPSPAFVAGVDFDPGDPGEREVVRLASERHAHERMRELEEENARLRAALAGRPVEIGTAAHAAVERWARDGAPVVCDCDGNAMPGVWSGMNGRGEVQRCDDCGRFWCDDDAAESLAYLLDGEAVELLDDERDDGATWWGIYRDGDVMTGDEIRDEASRRKGE